MKFEMMKQKYRDLIKNQESEDILILVNKVMTELQYLLVKNNDYDEQELINKIHSLNGIDTTLYNRLLSDIKTKALFKRES